MEQKQAADMSVDPTTYGLAREAQDAGRAEARRQRLLDRDRLTHLSFGSPDAALPNLFHSSSLLKRCK